MKLGLFCLRKGYSCAQRVAMIRRGKDISGTVHLLHVLCMVRLHV